MNKIKILALMGVLSFPSLALAAPGNFKELVKVFTDLIGMVIPVLMAFSVLVFLWGLVEYMRTSGKERDEAKSFIVWGIITLFVMVSIWGLVGVLQGTVFGGSPNTPPLPFPLVPFI